MGPTASGKTALAVALAKYHDVEIINVDSTLVYRGMDIGTAKPTPEELAVVPHHLIDIRDPSVPYSSAEFRQDALIAIEDILARGKLPILVGGTMLYFHVLQNGLAPLPAADVTTRSALVAEIQAEGLSSLYAELERVDPVAASRIKPTDSQRIQRAVEVHRLTGKSLSAWCDDQLAQNLPYQTINIAIVPNDRATLHERIAIRFTKMLKRGFLEEVERLYSRPDLHSDLPAMRAVGYRQAWDYLAGCSSYDVMQERGIIATRQLAKRQLTWIRGWRDIQLFNSEAADLVQHVLMVL
ncbi:MAG: tRNA (adenosine(37)-N6)-dimethylallyltransferase MiaA [Pseudomonadota bacterium]|nr:tRNA (adenosine(37)-N6)-dimethylallyltransferase MiaA [Pseudomonadota bacterium]